MIVSTYPFGRSFAIARMHVAHSRVTIGKISTKIADSSTRPHP
ncbi:hypothetical protein HMPREF9006_1653 [Actinomyces sp. oral taxon 180 str. F0310]|nr:hypothetical protein HMPREF9006_1653 [Actinomyces sp. oral taxon 180 str. F0310]